MPIPIERLLNANIPKNKQLIPPVATAATDTHAPIEWNRVYLPL
jgi:hypothetical protein